MGAAFRRAGGLLLAALGLNSLGAFDAAAQASLGSAKHVAVRDRARPEYDAPGVRAGGFLLYPEIQASAQYDDNIFAVRNNTKSDYIGVFTAQARLASQWSTHALNAQAGATTRQYSDFSTENTTSYNFGVNGRLDVDRSAAITGGVQFLKDQESRSSSPSIVPLAAPVEYSLSAANVSAVKSFNRLRLSGQAGVSTYEYENSRSTAGAVVNQKDRNRSVYIGVVRGEYSVSPDTALYTEVRLNRRDYDLAPPRTTIQRDSEGYEALVGARFDLSNLLRGEIGAGMISQSYKARGVSDTNGVAVRGNVQWFPDELVTVSFGVARDIGDAGVDNAAGYISNGANVAIDYELRRNLILGLSAGYSSDDYSGIDRKDTRVSTVASADYGLNRGVALFANVGRYEQSSSGKSLGREYDINRAMVGVKLRR